MPYPNEHAARLQDPEKYKGKFARQSNKLGAGIDVIFGITGEGKSEIQAIRFSKSKYTAAQAREWLKEHDFRAILFEPAGEAKDAMETAVFHFDRMAFRKKAEITDEGYIRTDAVVTRTGVFYYMNTDGTIRREFRPPEEVFKADSLATMRMIPITDKHPSNFVDAKNAKDLAVGATGENITHDDRDVIAPLVIMRADAVENVKAGRRELSLGYRVDLVAEDGEFEGEKYDFKQTNIRYNHLALVDRARAGRDAAIHVDAIRADTFDGLEISREQYEEIRNDSQFNNLKRKVQTMPTFKIDGIDYEAAQEVINHIGKLQGKIDGLTGEVATAKANADTAAAERDDAKDKLQNEQEKNSDAAIAARVIARTDLERKAGLVLDAEAMKDISKKTDSEIKAAVVVKACDGIDIAGKSAEYVAARFDIAIEAATAAAAGNANQFAAANCNGKKIDNDDDGSDSSKAHDRMKKNQDEAYRNYGKEKAA